MLYIFYVQYIKEVLQILQSINIVFRKKKLVLFYGRCVIVKDVIDNDFVNKFISYNDGFRVLRNIRGFLVIWQKIQYDFKII